MSPPTTIHHHPLSPTSSQNISTTHQQPKYPPPPTTTPKMDHHLAKAKIYSYITSFGHCFNSSFFYKIRYSFTWRRFYVIKFWSIRFWNSKLLQHFTIFKIFYNLYFKSLRLQDLFLFVFINVIVILT